MPVLPLPQPDLLTRLSDTEILGFTALGEAANQPVEGQIAVLMTARNRARAKGTSMGQQCLRPYQYSCWNDGDDANHIRLLHAVMIFLDAGHVVGDRPMLQQTMFLASGVYHGDLLDNISGATHYLTKALFISQPPKWARGQTPTRTYGDHVFFAQIAF